MDGLALRRIMIQSRGWLGSGSIQSLRSALCYRLTSSAHVFHSHGWPGRRLAVVGAGWPAPGPPAAGRWAGGGGPTGAAAGGGWASFVGPGWTRSVLAV